MVLETEPIDIKLDDDGDMDLSSGGPEFTYGVQAVAQGIRIVVQIIRGECIYDKELGVPWFENDMVGPLEALLGFQFSKIKTLTELRKAALSAPHEITIRELTAVLDGETRFLDATIKVNTVFGETEVTISTGDL